MSYDPRFRFVDVSYTPAAVVAAGGSGEDSVAVPGATPNDLVVCVGKPAAFDTGVGIGGLRAAANLVYILWLNAKASGDVTPAAGTYTFLLMAKQPTGKR